jgi:hypothetical protein
MMEASSGNRTHRAVSILLVLVLHALLIFALLRFMAGPQNSAFVPETHLFEMIINTARFPKPSTTKPAPALAPRIAQPLPQTRVPREPVAPSFPTPAPDIRGFGQALADCAPEKLSGLDQAQRARCQRFGASTSHDPSAVDYADHSNEVRGAKQWARELARKKAPLLLPCGNAKAVDFVYTGACIIANIANGFTFQKQYENQPAYFDEPGK